MESRHVADEVNYPGKLARGSKGAGVKRVQEWLCLTGTGTGIDGEFGPATASALSHFQSSRGLTQTGVLDETTWEMLVQPMSDALRPISSGATLAARCVAHAQQHLRQHPREVGGPNAGPWVRLYMKGAEGPPYAWCAGFASFLAERAAAELGGAALPFKSTFSCDELAASAKKTGSFRVGVGTGAPVGLGPGTIFLRRKTSTDWEHAGVVTGIEGESFRTIEGNTNDEGSREGYEVCARVRAFGAYDFVIV